MSYNFQIKNILSTILLLVTKSNSQYYDSLCFHVYFHNVILNIVNTIIYIFIIKIKNKNKIKLK
jgi:hypothetical protein